MIVAKMDKAQRLSNGQNKLEQRFAVLTDYKQFAVPSVTFGYQIPAQRLRPTGKGAASSRERKRSHIDPELSAIVSAFFICHRVFAVQIQLLVIIVKAPFVLLRSLVRNSRSSAFSSRAAPMASPWEWDEVS
jgi:hypothetical protein